MSVKDLNENDIFNAIEQMMTLPKPKTKPKPIKLPKHVCGICGQSKHLLSPEFSENLFKLVPKFKQLFDAGSDYRVCKTCLRELLKIHVRVRNYRRVVKMDIKLFRKLAILKAKYGNMLHIEVSVDYQRYRDIVRRKIYRRYAQLASWDFVNRIRELHERQAQLRKQRRQPKDLISVEDVIDIVEGRAVERPPTSCRDCTRAVCPKDCPYLQMAVMLLRFKGSNRIDIDEYQLSDYEDFP